jgi:hypothetical protein
VRDVIDKSAGVGGFQRLRAVGDTPGEGFLVDVGEQDAAGEKARCGVHIEEGLGVEDDRVAALLGREIQRDAVEEAGQQFLVGKGELEADPGE